MALPEVFPDSLSQRACAVYKCMPWFHVVSKGQTFALRDRLGILNSNLVYTTMNMLATKPCVEATTPRIQILCHTS